VGSVISIQQFLRNTIMNNIRYIDTACTLDLGADALATIYGGADAEGELKVFSAAGAATVGAMGGVAFGSGSIFGVYPLLVGGVIAGTDLL
jgi:hypothetical protein